MVPVRLEIVNKSNYVTALLLIIFVILDIIMLHLQLGKKVGRDASTVFATIKLSVCKFLEAFFL